MFLQHNPLRDIVGLKTTKYPTVIGGRIRFRAPNHCIMILDQRTRT